MKETPFFLEIFNDNNTIRGLFLVFFICIFNNIFSQTSERFEPIEKWITRIQDSGTIVYTEKLNDWSVIKMKRVLKKRRIKLMDGEYYGNDLKLTRKEKKYLENQIDSLSMHVWKDNLFPNSKSISFDSIYSFIENHRKNLKRTIINDSIQGMREVILSKDYSLPNIFTFSKPIFFRNDSFSMFYIFWNLGYHGGTEEVLFYKKENNSWIKWTVADKIWY